MTNLPIIMMGDTHSISILISTMAKADLSDCIVIHVGDIGIFDRYLKDIDTILEGVNNTFRDKNITFYGIRGNHDDPAYFTEEYFNKFDHLKLVPDYTKINIQGEEFLFVGGAISVNRKDLVQNDDWWEDEVFVLKPELAVSCDVLITHTTHPYVGPVDKSRITHFLDNDPSLWSQLQIERRNLHTLFKKVRPKKHYCGHFHVSEALDHMGCMCRILNVGELREHRSTYESI